MRILLILILAALMDAARSFAPESGLGSGTAGTALACGYLLLTAFFAGSLFRSVGLPRLTGYLVAGMVTGPEVLHLVSASMVDYLGIFNGVAIALISLTAGVELDLTVMRPLLKSVSWAGLIAVGGTAALLTFAVHLLSPSIPFLHALTPLQSWAMSAVLGVTLVAQSPAVVVALQAETRSDGPLTRTVLGVVVMSDLLVIVFFAIVSTLAKTTFGNRADVWQTAGVLGWEVLGSFAAGVVISVLLAVYLRYVKGSGALFVVATAFLTAEVGQRIGLDPLLISIAAGILIRNATRHGARLQEEIEASSLPVYIVFFAVTGATIHVRSLQVLWAPAAILVVTRGLGFVSGGWLASRIAGAPAAVRNYIGFGLMPQAGLALALALLFVRTFPQLGADAAVLVLGVVALNEMGAPVLYRLALERTHEAGQALNHSEELAAQAAPHEAV